MQDQYTENHKTELREIKKEKTGKQYCLWGRKLNIVKHQISLKTQQAFFKEIEKQITKFIWISKQPRLPKTI